ncbi:hypothetical protein B0T24DRAFT_639317 [Lasiosphaeria ovina]|uniref:Secreted protein n=1 Tax=Lasiosphaeria ovina TaxID=92902 RepID=A0AAE0JVN0_9PEZI|nr:hypothetical protein B0T24DRAFT_639317 [Lasiosphaeria ovina]
MKGAIVLTGFLVLCMFVRQILGEVQKLLAPSSGRQNPRCTNGHCLAAHHRLKNKQAYYRQTARYFPLARKAAGLQSARSGRSAQMGKWAAQSR